MKRFFITGFSLILLFSGCHHKQVEEADPLPKAIVEATKFKTGKLSEEISLQAQSMYLVKNYITTPVNCYIQKVFISLGDKVNAGQVLYKIVTKERIATEGLTTLKDTSLRDYGVILIKTDNQGIISSIIRQAGDYIPEGTQICQISNIQSLAFKLQVPFEYNNLVRPGEKCKIEMADGKFLDGTVKNELDQVNMDGQTRQYLVQVQSDLFIPENLLATVKVITNTSESNQILPVECLLSDEMMQKFWIMKLINDTTAVKVDVKIGIKNKTLVEILEPQFEPDARILSSGNYGLPEHAYVNVEKH